MAWRITDYIERGEIDNHTRGRVHGQIWLNGIDHPVQLELTGNPYRDLAGQRLKFLNPHPQPMPDHLRRFAREQTGVIGDMTAARKVKILDIPDDELKHYYTNKIPMPYHWGNCLYLEWHSVRNGRVVIEATDFVLEVEPEAAWQMSEGEEAEQLEANGRAMINFMDQLLEAGNPTHETSDEENASLSAAEAAADAEAARMDLLNDRVMARLEKDELANAEDYARILREERERIRRERGEDEPKPFGSNEEADHPFHIDTINSDFAEAMAKEDEPCDLESHPLFEQCQQLSYRAADDLEQNDWLPEGAQEEHPLNALKHGIWMATVKLAGALNGRVEEWPPDPLFAGDCLVRLKKARRYLKDALAALDAAEAEKLTDPVWCLTLRQELRGILQSAQNLIHEVRSALNGSEH
ncbi:MAG: hypothetical protein EA353_06610 [Puniceicoccaceae bacterium]|nr:MAG: hypothetical protein EA353_06610 [Puniceicoccaceae bacterium]